MIVKRKLFSVMDEEGNLGYYLYDENNGEERMFSVVEDERLYARGTGAAVYYAEQMMRNKGNKIVNKAANREYLINEGKRVFDLARKVEGTNNWAGRKKLSGFDINPNKHSLNDVYLKVGKRQGFIGESGKRAPSVIRTSEKKIPGDIKYNKRVMEIWKD